MPGQTLQNERGFTIAELVTVIAIIGVLIGLASPVVAQQVDNARRNHDIACVEDAVAAAKAEFAYAYTGHEGTVRVYAFNAATGEASTSNPSKGYGQWEVSADYAVEGIPVEGVAKDSFVSCTIIDGEVTSLRWGSLAPGGLYRHAAELYGDKSVELADNTARERLLVDVDTIRAMAFEYLGLTKDEIIEKSGLNPNYQGRLNNDEGVSMITYRNQGGKNPQVRGDTTLLEELGFAGDVGTTSPNSFSSSSTRLFFSDFLNSGIEAQIMFGKVEYDAEGKATRIKAWIRVITYNGVDLTIPDELSNIYVEA